MNTSYIRNDFVSTILGYGNNTLVSYFQLNIDLTKYAYNIQNTQSRQIEFNLFIFKNNKQIENHLFNQCLYLNYTNQRQIINKYQKYQYEMYQRHNGLDNLIINKGYLSERTKSPQRINPHMQQHQQFYQNNIDMYPNVNRLNSNRDMSPNKIISKHKPLLNNGIVINNRVPLANNNFNNYQIPIVQSQHKYGSNLYDHKNFISNQPNAYQNNTQNWNNIKSPRSPQIQNTNFGHQFSNGNIHCFNHAAKKAQFLTQTDGQPIYYCQTCAAKLAAQNFIVKRLNSQIKHPNSKIHKNAFQNHQHSNKLIYKPRQIPNFPKYRGNPVYQSIIQFLKQVSRVQQIHYQNHQQLQSLDKHYQHQIQMVDEFYHQLLDILQTMRKDHINDLNEQKVKNSQVKDIYLNQIYQNLQSIDMIVNDLKENFETVVNRVTNQDIQFFNQCLDKNRSNIRFFNNQIEQQKDTLQEVTNYKEERLAQMIAEFQKSLLQLWAEPKRIQSNRLQSHNQFAKPINNQQKIAGINIKLPVSTIGPTNNFSTVQNNPKIQQNHQNNYQTQKHTNYQNQNNFYQTVEMQQNNKINGLQMHNNLHNQTLARDFQGKGACRQIFDDDEQQQALTQQVSPKFKNI